MITNNSLQRVFMIKCNGKQGTAFTVEIDELQYLVTAKHMIEDLELGMPLEIFHDSTWKNFPIKTFWISQTGADVALISLVNQISPVTPVRIGAEIFVGQDIYFLGFPFGLKTEAGQINNGYPIPLVKKGMVSSFSIPKTGSKAIICEGMNNPGFSGGPIVFLSPNGEIYILGIVAKYKLTGEPILINGRESGLTYLTNTGLFIGYDLSEIEAEAKRVRNGAPIRRQ